MDSNSESDNSEIEDSDIDEADRNIQDEFRNDFVSGWSDNDFSDDDADDGAEEETDLESGNKKILWAAENGDIEVIRRLLNLDPNLIKSVDKDGYTPLHRAAYNNNLNVLELLLEENADTNAETLDGWTPLHSACHWNRTACAEKLLSFGVNVNTKSHGGITPLHLAASNNRGVETLQTLLLHPDIDTTICNDTHETAYEIAFRKSRYAKYFEVAEPCFNFI